MTSFMQAYIYSQAFVNREYDYDDEVFVDGDIITYPSSVKEIHANTFADVRNNSNIKHYVGLDCFYCNMEQVTPAMMEDDD